MKKLNIIFVLIALVLCILPFVYSAIWVHDDQFHWLCMGKGDKLVAWECTSDCCIVCEKNGYNNYPSYRCNSLSRCSCGGNNNNSGTLDVQPPVITLTSPNNGLISGSRSVQFNISLDEISDLYYLDDQDVRRGFKKICSSCTKFNNKISFSEGAHTITLKAEDKSGNEANKTVSFFIDSVKPRISKTLPAAKAFANGTFVVQYDEDNVEKIRLDYNQGLGKSEVVRTDCPKGKKQECVFFVPGLSQGPLSYYFIVEDKINSVQSKEVNVSVDTLAPIMTITQPLSGAYGRTVPFAVNVNEKVKLEYIDYSQKNPRWSNLCSSCIKYNSKKYFAAGTHNLDIRATDLAGNSVKQSVSIVVS